MKRKFKRRISAILLSALIAFSAPMASAYYNLPLDVGNFNDYGGGGDWGDDWGGGTYTYDYDYDYGGSGYSGEADLGIFGDAVVTLVILIVVVGIVLSIVYEKKNKNRNTSYSSRPIPAMFMPTDNTSPIEKVIKANDPDFSADKFVSWSKNIFITLQNAWTERDWEKVRKLEKEELFEQHNTQLSEYIRLHRINVIERINVNQTFLYKYVRDKNYEHLTVCMNVRMMDYIIDEKSGRVLMGSNKEDIYMTYLLTFMRSNGVKSDVMKGVMSASCPHCGAPVDSASAGKCEYCGSVIHLGEYNWVLSDMQAVKPGFKNSDRCIIINDGKKKGNGNKNKKGKR